MTTHLGKLLRINIDTPDDVPYAVPQDNPYARPTGPDDVPLRSDRAGLLADQDRCEARDLGYGLRNPYMFHFDKRSGDLFIADVGQNHWEEINYQPASSKGGENWLEAQPGLQVPSPQGTRRKLRNRRRPSRGRVSARGALSGRGETEDGFGCSAQGLGVANYAGLEDLPGRRLVLRTALRRRLGQEREQVADAGVHADAAAVHGRKRRG